MVNQAVVSNRLLRTASADDFGLLAPHLIHMALNLRQSIIQADTPVDRFVFPESGFISVTNSSRDGTVEVGLIGREGTVGASPILLGSDRTPHDHYVQAPGEAFSITVDAVVAVAEHSPSFRGLLLRYVQSFLVQTAETAFVNATYTIETRLARWLLMCQDRMLSDDLSLTHEFLSIMLGVQRTSVTLALQTIEASGSIRARRGRIKVRDRDLLRAAAGDSYGAPEAEYERLMGL